MPNPNEPNTAKVFTFEPPKGKKKIATFEAAKKAFKDNLQNASLNLARAIAWAGFPKGTGILITTKGVYQLSPSETAGVVEKDSNYDPHEFISYPHDRLTEIS